jgi:hypothetical protein
VEEFGEAFADYRDTGYRFAVEERPLQPSAGLVVTDASAKSAMSWYQTLDGSGSIAIRSSSSSSIGARRPRHLLGSSIQVRLSAG